MFGPIDGEGDLENGEIDLTIKPTHDTYEPLQYAYEHFNLALFDHRLPNCLITLQRKGRCFGYFAAGRMTRRDGATCDEIALNPVHFRDQGDLQTLSVLVHEMVHLWQTRFGQPGRGRYHNKQWAREIKRVGLHPSHTGAPGGRETGDRMGHYIVSGGLFERAARDLIAGGFVIAWTEDRPPRRRSRPQPGPGPGPGEDRPNDPDQTPSGEAAQDGATSERLGGEDGEVALVEPLDGLLEPRDSEAGALDLPSKSGVRVKYSCPVCGLNAWSRHGAELKCGVHDLIMDPVV